jgi:hypothetical protein
MDNLSKYDEFVNEEISRKSLLATAVPIVLGAGAFAYQQSCTHKGVADFDKVEVVSNTQFKQYDLFAKGESFNLTIKDDFIVSQHSYTTEEGTGENKHTETHSFTNLMIPSGTKFIWYKTKTFGGTYASPKQFEGSHLIKPSDLKLYKKLEGFSIYRVSGWFPTFNYVIIITDPLKIEGEKYKLSDNNLGYYVCREINRDIYVFAPSAGYGHFGGGGAGESF